MNVILLFGHRARVGKDTSAEFLKNFGYKRFAFADKLKETVKDLYNFSDDQMFGDYKDLEDYRYLNTIDPEKIVDEKTWGDSFDIQLALDNGCEYEDMLVDNPGYKPYFTPRRILQIFGQGQRQVYPDIWANYVYIQIEKDINKHLNADNFYCITDFRFKNEYDVGIKWLKKTNISNTIIVPVKIVRDVEIKTGSNDISEHDLDDFNKWDYIIYNNDSLSSLYENLSKLDYFIKRK